jgi:hypothetical protein
VKRAKIVLISSRLGGFAQNTGSREAAKDTKPSAMTADIKHYPAMKFFSVLLLKR